MDFVRLHFEGKPILINMDLIAAVNSFEGKTRIWEPNYKNGSKSSGWIVDESLEEVADILQEIIDRKEINNRK